MDEQSTDEYTRLVAENGLALLFTNRVRARVVAALFYASEPLPVDRIAEGAGVDRTVVHEALDGLERFGILEIDRTEGRDPDRYALDESDDLTEALRAVAELATERYHQEEIDIPSDDE
ncbi:GntR family transcriptional regulator [Halorubrum ezzemoulense]|jgi:DNA-binding GntR family transcriptional regulator|uniref:GntR family transcriptional regulator n=1 Tax=Halorubrum ezzemoulense TaxID=337243 RepID=A0A256IYZ7_HALEZ|nr:MULTISPECIES: GntR family transcriptional regulator [Halorubrum]MDB2223095.1 GntR family transcriptional regulator [Halorubrum ezzemoulense]MDB2237938.1 GntR family transcriptional regulator [Halorubrum ezzemoulense]MDB2240468.1 GntR family transcriptional regulator [Halorubrum ezzemoulense]MDB2243657.1 GntR family transcriptional regulator [Halorubrum ezzemoulense]MDB2249532.1 GntR family transcriptional regulator [Halorubrum ezzemoulense]